MGSAVFVHPLELLKFRMQLSGEKGATVDHKNSFQAIVNMAKNEKLSGFYKGISANFTRQLVFTSTRVGLYITLVEELKKWDRVMIRAGIRMLWIIKGEKNALKKSKMFQQYETIESWIFFNTKRPPSIKTNELY